VRELLNLRMNEYDDFSNHITMDTITVDYFGTTLFNILDLKDGEEIHQLNRILKYVATLVEDKNNYEDDEAKKSYMQ
jgi:hypothetical protein